MRGLSRHRGSLAFALLGLIFAGLWASGLLAPGFAALHKTLFTAQREFQSVLAGGVRALKANEPWAVANLAWLGFLYGVLHAVGPGHGKVVLGAWAFSAKAKLARVALITLAASLAQSLVAIALVLGGAALFGLGRRELTDLAEGPVTRAGYWLLAALGLWLMLRGAVALWRTIRAGRAQAKAQPTSHAHAHTHDDACGCGHVHGPSPEKAARANLPEALMLIAGVALRPCTGAVFVMLLTLLIGAPFAGALSVMAMGLGTALITLVIALLSARMGGQILGGAGASLRLHLIAACAQIAIGGLLLALYLVP